MGLDLSSRQQIFLDTSPFIYYFEENPDYINALSSLWDQIYQYDINVITSFITYIELLTLPEREGDHRLTSRYRESLTNSDRISIYPLNMLVADATVRYRADYNLKTPDAIQLATADICGAEVIVTNDADWKRIDKMEVVLVSELST